MFAGYGQVTILSDRGDPFEFPRRRVRRWSRPPSSLTRARALSSVPASDRCCCCPPRYLSVFAFFSSSVYFFLLFFVRAYTRAPIHIHTYVYAFYRRARSFGAHSSPARRRRPSLFRSLRAPVSVTVHPVGPMTE